MQKKELCAVPAPVLDTYALTVCALLTALSVVLARLLTIIPSEVSRFSLEAVPILLAGLLFGPLPGAAVGFAADFIGCLFSPFGYNPIFCLPPILYGLCAGLFRPWLTQKISPLRIAAAFLPAIVLGSILYQSGSLALIYGGESKLAFFVTKLATRSVQFAVTSVLDVLLVWALCRSRVFTVAGVWPTAAQPAQKGVSGQ